MHTTQCFSLLLIFTFLLTACAAPQAEITPDIVYPEPSAAPATDEPTAPGTPPADAGGTPQSADCGLSDDDYAIYAAILQARYLRPEVQRLVLYQQTVAGDFGDQAYIFEDFVRQSFPDEADDMLAAMPEAFARPCWLEARFGLSLPVNFISEADAQALFVLGPKSWDAYYQRFPGAQGLMELSRPVYNAAKDKALVYVGNQQGGLAGGGYNFSLVKRDGVWEIWLESMTWIS